VDAKRPVAVGRRAVTAEHPWSLSPAALRAAPRTPDLVLPSPNGSAISAAIKDHCGVVAAGLRNATAVARWLRAQGVGTRERPLTVIAAGERWPDTPLRPALEDLLGAGAVIAALGAGNLSPEATAAAAAYVNCRDPAQALMDSASGRELAATGFAGDVTIAAEIDKSTAVPVLTDGAFTPAHPGRGAG
jgi:2-phosphosulfolactate phosphatase